MATIEGNEIALRKVASELMPPVRSGQDARTDQDSAGAPFITCEYRVFDEYGPFDPFTQTYQPAQSFAPCWVYGMMLEQSWAGVNQSGSNGSGDETPRYFVSFGTAQKQNEVEITPGKVLMFPRGARRVFIRSNQTLQMHPPATIRVTWVVDRFASIATGGATGPNVSRTWLGDGKVDSITLNNSIGGFTEAFDGYTNLSIYISNGTNGVATYDLNFQGDTLDTANIPAGATRLISYGPGVGTLGAGAILTGHGIVLPFGGLIFDFGFPAPVTGTVVYSWRAY